MMTAWLVLTGRWNMTGSSEDDTPFGLYFMEAACEFYWILRMTEAL